MRRIFPVLVVVLVLVSASAGGWWWVCGRLDQGLAAWEAAQRAQGWTIAHGPTSHAGWPLRARLVVPGLRVAGAGQQVPGGLVWQAERVLIDYDVLHPRTLAVRPAGGQTLRVAGGPEIALRADVLEVSVPLDPDTPPDSADLTARGVHVAVAGQAGETVVGLLTANLTVPLDGATASLAAAAEAIMLPASRTWPLGPSIGSLAVQATLSGLATAAPGPAGWRDAGGRLDIRQVSLGWGPLGLTGQGSLALDGQLQPAGMAALRLVGADATLDALVASHALAPRSALAMRAVLGLMTVTPADGGAPQVQVPLAIHDRTLAMGQIPLARMPEVIWPAPR